jgi:hypothetical protein
MKPFPAKSIIALQKIEAYFDSTPIKNARVKIEKDGLMVTISYECIFKVRYIHGFNIIENPRTN